MAVCLCPSCLICSHTLFRMCTCISTWIYAHLTVHVCSLPLRIVSWKHGCPYVLLCVCTIHPACVPTHCLECVHVSVHEFISPNCPCMVPTLGIVSWKLGCPYFSLCVCPSHPGCGPTPCLECVHASVHEFMSIWLPMSGPPPMHSFKENWVPLYSSVFLSQSPHFCSYTLFRMCTCIYVACLCCHTFFRMCTISSTWIYVHLTTHVSSIPYAQFYGILCAPMCHCVCPSHPACGPLILFRMCACISTWLYVHLAAHIWSTSYA